MLGGEVITAEREREEVTLGRELPARDMYGAGIIVVP
jgi:hypothetical protein